MRCACETKVNEQGARSERRIWQHCPPFFTRLSKNTHRRPPDSAAKVALMSALAARKWAAREARGGSGMVGCVCRGRASREVKRV